jgi:D-cysteine desulfhydrase
LIRDLAVKVAAKLGMRETPPADKVLCFGDYVGKGYSIPTDGMVEAVQMLARQEAILMDPVYTGKAMAGMIDLIRKGFFKKDETILFVHTGGAPALYAYLDSFM